MDAEGRALAPAAGTVVNALATGIGSAFAIDADVTATVSLSPGEGVAGEVAGAPDADTRLVEACVERVVDRFADEPLGGTVKTESEVPMASGLKSSSAAANATVLATLDALDAVEAVSREDAARIGVAAAREVGVTVTGAFDDASASMLGGLTITNNEQDALLSRDEVQWDVLVWTPPEQSFSADADVERCRRVAPVVEVATELALGGRYAEAMNVNGLAFCAALDCDTEPLVAAFPAAAGASLSGTGPSYVAVGERDSLAAVEEIWTEYEGTTWLTTTQTAGARTNR